MQRLRSKITKKKQVEQKAIVIINNLAVVLFIFKANIFPVSTWSKQGVSVVSIQNSVWTLKISRMKKCFRISNLNIFFNKGKENKS